MLEDGLKDVNKKEESEREKLNNHKIEDTLKDNVGAHYLKVVNHVSFDELTI